MIAQLNGQGTKAGVDQVEMVVKYKKQLQSQFSEFLTQQLECVQGKEFNIARVAMGPPSQQAVEESKTEATTRNSSPPPTQQKVA